MTGFRLALLTVLALLAASVAPAAAAWRAPVDGNQRRPFVLPAAPYGPGGHRGLDFGASPGAPVIAPCSGRVAFAGTVGDAGRVVSLVCGAWRVSLLPLEATEVRAGARVARGARLGRAGRAFGHAGLHVGVRREARRDAYVDPAPLFAAGPRFGPLSARPPGTSFDRPRGGLVGDPVRAPSPSRVPAPVSDEKARQTAPDIVWAGLFAMLLAGAGSTRVRACRRRAARRAQEAPVAAR